MNRFLEWLDPLAARYQQWGFADASTFIDGGAGHEPINETNRDEVVAHLMAWFDRMFRRYSRTLPSGLDR